MIGNIFNKEYLPLPAQKSSHYLYEWIEDRSVPITRHGVKSLLKEEQTINTGIYMLDNLGLSLTDCYWLVPAGKENLKWNDVNLFYNDFSSAMILSNTNDVKQIYNSTKFSKYTPDATLKGDLKKKWIIRDNGTRMLLKGNFGVGCQQSLNEKFASLVCRKQQAVPYVEYETIPFSFTEEDSDAICCISENFIKDDSKEFVCAYDLLQSEKEKGSISSYQQFVNACEKVELDRKEVKDFLSFQIMLDYLLTNTDRHFNNFGIIRDTETLKPISMAPIYDTGSCLFWNRNRPVFIEGMMDKIRVHSFVKWEDRLLKYVEDKNCLNLSKLPTDQEMYDIFSEGGVLPEERISFIMQCFHEKARMIDRMQEKQALMKYDMTRQKIIPLNSSSENSVFRGEEISEEEERE